MFPPEIATAVQTTWRLAQEAATILAGVEAAKSIFNHYNKKGGRNNPARRNQPHHIVHRKAQPEMALQIA